MEHFGGLGNSLIVLASGTLMFSGLVLLVFDVPSMLMAVMRLMAMTVRASRLSEGGGPAEP